MGFGIHMTRRKRLTPFARLTLDPAPVRGRTESQPSANARALRAWRKGIITLTVRRDGFELTPDDIAWDTLPATSGPSGRHAEPQTRVTLSARGAELLAAVRPQYASDSAAVEAGLGMLATQGGGA